MAVSMSDVRRVLRDTATTLNRILCFAVGGEIAVPERLRQMGLSDGYHPPCDGEKPKEAPSPKLSFRSRRRLVCGDPRHRHATAIAALFIITLGGEVRSWVLRRSQGISATSNRPSSSP